MATKNMVLRRELHEKIAAGIDRRLKPEYDAFYKLYEEFKQAGMSFKTRDALESVFLDAIFHATDAAFALGVECGAGDWRKLVLEADYTENITEAQKQRWSSAAALEKAEA